MNTIDIAPGGYRTIPAVFQYSAGVSALPGFAIRRVRFLRPVPLAAGFGEIERLISEAGRPLTAFCACELRSPSQFTDAGFRAFNEGYAARLRAWNIVTDALNPVARSNVCPEVDPPEEPGFHAFSYTVEVPGAPPSFVISGSGESHDGDGPYRDRIVRLGDTSPDAVREKVRHVMEKLASRLAALGFTWTDTSSAQAYTVHDIHPFMETEIVRRGAAAGGLTWHWCRPPVVGLEFEMDCRHVAEETVV